MKQYLSLAITAALRAGSEILDVYTGTEIAVDLKDDRSPLTEADRRAHRVIEATLSGGADAADAPGAPSIPILSEEGKSIPYPERSGWDLFWLVDPLDGTKEFIKRNGEFTVNIALIRKGVPILGVIYVPVKRTLYFASEEAGSFKLEDVQPEMAAAPRPADARELHPVSLPQSASLQDLITQARKLPEHNGRTAYTVVASRSHLSPETEVIIAEKREQHGGVEIASMGSSLKLCMVAEGSADIYPRLAPTMEWDTAAGHAIASFAGCRVYDHHTRAGLRYNKENLLNPWFIVERSVLKR